MLIIQQRGRTERIAVAQNGYRRVELKYGPVRTATHSYILDSSLDDLEEKYRADCARIHRNALIARRASAGVGKASLYGGG